MPKEQRIEGQKPGEQIEFHPNFDVRMSFLMSKKVPPQLIRVFEQSGGNVAGNPDLMRILRPVLRAEMVDTISRQNGQGGRGI